MSLTQRNKSPVPQKTPAEIRQCRKITDFNWATGFLGQYHELQTLYGTTNAPLTSPAIDMNHDLIDETEGSRLKRNNNFGYAYAQKLKDITEYIIQKADNYSRNINMPNLVEDPHSNIKKPLSYAPPVLTNRSLQNIKLVTSSPYTTREVREFRAFEETPTMTRPRSNSPQESPSPDFRKSNQNYDFREEKSDVDEIEEGDKPVYLDDSKNMLQNSQVRANGLYVITDKPVSQRYWQMKFEEKPEIPIKQVDLSKKSQRKIQAGLEESHYEMDNSSFSPMYKMTQRLETSNRSMYNSEEVSPYENPYQKAKYLPYFQYSSSNLKTASSLGVKSALTERSQSPLSSPAKQSNFKQFMENEVLYISKGTPSSGMKDGFMSASKNPNYIAPDARELSPKAAPLSSAVNSSIAQSSKLMSSKLTRGINKKNNQNNLDYVIVDANKRYMLPRSPKYNKAKKVEFLKESSNKQSSLRYLSNMAD
jgi:hypothetical protein